MKSDNSHEHTEQPQALNLQGTQIEYVPHDYPMCLNRQCPQASTCLRQIAAEEVSDSARFWTIISPKHLAAITGDCPFYRCNTKVSYAKGFMNILNALPHQQRRNVIALIISQFSQRTYYRIRKGERFISPSEQQRIRDILKQCGVTEAKEFDAYTEGVEW